MAATVISILLSYHYQVQVGYMRRGLALTRIKISCAQQMSCYQTPLGLHLASFPHHHRPWEREAPMGSGYCSKNGDETQGQKEPVLGSSL
jgi:hypothetical protein